MAEKKTDKLDDSGMESTTVTINRTSSTVKGGRRMSFAALVVVGDRRGNVGIGYGKSKAVPTAIEKAQKYAKKGMFKVALEDGTLPHAVAARFGASSVRLIPAAPGTGVIAGGTVRAVLEMAGIQDCLTKAYGSRNQANLCKAVVAGLQTLQSRQKIESLRGVKIGASRIERILDNNKKAMASMPAASVSAAPKGKPAKADATESTPA